MQLLKEMYFVWEYAKRSEMLLPAHHLLTQCYLTIFKISVNKKIIFYSSSLLHFPHFNVVLLCKVNIGALLRKPGWDGRSLSGRSKHCE